MAKTALKRKTIVGPTELARHLVGNRELVARLCQSGVIEVLPSGKYDLDDCRTRYIRYLRSRPPRGEANAQLIAARVRLAETRLAERERHLIATTEAEGAIQNVVARVVLGLQELVDPSAKGPARTRRGNQTTSAGAMQGA